MKYPNLTGRLFCRKEVPLHKRIDFRRRKGSFSSAQFRTIIRLRRCQSGQEKEHEQNVKALPHRISLDRRNIKWPSFPQLWNCASGGIACLLAGSAHPAADTVVAEVARVVENVELSSVLRLRCFRPGPAGDRLQ